MALRRALFTTFATGSVAMLLSASGTPAPLATKIPESRITLSTPNAGTPADDSARPTLGQGKADDDTATAVVHTMARIAPRTRAVVARTACLGCTKPDDDARPSAPSDPPPSPAPSNGGSAPVTCDARGGCLKDSD